MLVAFQDRLSSFEERFAADLGVGRTYGAPPTMSQWLTNHSEIARRGGVVTHDDDFTVVACHTCGTQSLYNEETLQLYVDPLDLSRCFFWIEGEHLPRCRGCGDTEWDTDTL